jgi:hypothetical protein
VSDAINDLGAIATAGLAAHALDGPAGPVEGDHPEQCANCQAHLDGPFCRQCGQPAHLHRSLPHLVEEIAHGVFHFEGKVWRTLPLLAFKPGDLTRRYVHGERVRFVSPMALFLFCVFLMFAVISNLGGSGESDVQAAKTPAEARAQLTAKLTVLQADVATQGKARALVAAAGRDTEAYDEKLSDLRGKIADVEGDRAALLKVGPRKGQFANIRTGWKRLDAGIEEANENPNLLLYKLKMSAYKFAWALIPISLPFIWLLFAFRRDVTLYDHAVFAIYSISFVSLLLVTLSVLGAIGVPGQWLSLLFFAGVPLHLYTQLKGAYVLSRASALWRTGVLLVFASIAVLLFGCLILAIDLLA